MTPRIIKKKEREASHGQPTDWKGNEQWMGHHILDPEGVCACVWGVLSRTASRAVQESGQAYLPSHIPGPQDSSQQGLSNLCLSAAVQHPRQSSGLTMAAGWMVEHTMTLCKSLSQDYSLPWTPERLLFLFPAAPAKSWEARGPQQCASHKSHAAMVQAMRECRRKDFAEVHSDRYHC